MCVYVLHDLSIFGPLCFEFSEFHCLTSAAVEDFAQIPHVFMISLVFVRAEGYLEGFNLREGLPFVSANGRAIFKGAVVLLVNS